MALHGRRSAAGLHAGDGEDMKPTVACDFDGTCCEYAFPACGAPRDNVIQALRVLRAEGWRIIVHSTRVNADWVEPERIRGIANMLGYLLHHEIPFDAVWGLAFPLGIEGTHAFAWLDARGGGKPCAHVYLDDRSLWDRADATSAEIVAACRELYRRAEREYEEGTKVADKEAGR